MVNYSRYGLTIQPHGSVCRGFHNKLHKNTPILIPTALFSVVFRGDKRLAEGSSRVDEDAGGERHSQGEDPAYGGRHPEE